jgi:AcrR family transcriptional regulator
MNPRTPRWQAMNAARDAKVLDAACAVAGETGLQGLTRRAVAERAGVALGSVNLSYGDLAGLHRAVVQEAIARPLLGVLAQALAMGDPVARDAPDGLKAEALATVQ